MIRLLCRFLGHRWRRAHKSEDKRMKYCARCGGAAHLRIRNRKETQQ